jgi:hypothetical protein
VLNLNGLTALEQVVLVIAALLVAWVVFKILAGLLRIVLIVAIVACLWVFVLQPTLMHDDTGGQVVKLSPEAQYAVAEFSRCVNETLATVGTGRVSECKQRVIGVLQQSRGAEYAAEASRAIEALLNKSRQPTM